MVDRMSMPEPCAHVEFESFTEFTRVTDGADGPVTGYHVALRVQCKDCRLPFTFRGLPGGFNFQYPTTSSIAHEARLPIEPVPLAERERFEATVAAGDRARQEFLERPDGL